MAKRWETELKDATVSSFFSTFFASILLRHRSARHFPAEAEDELSEIDYCPLKHASAPRSSEMDPQSKRFGTTPNPQGRNSTSSRQSSLPFANGDDVFSSCRRYWDASEGSSLYSTITKHLDRDEQKAGSIYILVHPKHERFVKIGCSTEPKTPENRCEEWKASCKLDYKLHNKSYKTKYAKRVESLVFSDLYERRCEVLCRECRKIHNEWFDISPEEAEGVVNYWVNWIITLAPYRGLTLSHECIRGMFLSASAPSGEQNVLTDRMSLFLHDSSNRKWVDRTIILGRLSRKSTPPAEVLQAVKTIAAEDPSIEAQKILQNQASDALSEPEKSHSEPTHATPPKEAANRILKSPEIALPPTPPDSKAGSVRRILFPATSSAETTASSSPLPSPANMPPSRSLPTPLIPSPASSGENIRAAEEATPSKPRATRKRGSGTKNTQRRNGAESSKMPVQNASTPEVRLSMPPDNDKDQEASGRKAAQDKFNNQIDEQKASDDVLSPLRLPCPRIEPDDCLGSDPVESKPPPGTLLFRRKVSNVQAGTDRPTVHTPAQSAPNVLHHPRETIDFTLEDKANPDPDDRRRASAPQMLHTPPDSGSNKRSTRSRRLTLGKRISVGDTHE